MAVSSLLRSAGPSLAIDTIVQTGGPQTDPPRHTAKSFLDLICQDSELNVRAGELEARPPGAPTVHARRVIGRGLSRFRGGFAGGV